VWMCWTQWNETTYVESSVDKRRYLIRRGNRKSREYLVESANTLAEINRRVMVLINHLEDTYGNTLDKGYFIKKLAENYKPSVISEAAMDKRYTTYTINKQDMHICLRTRDEREQVYDINLLMYVVLHELAHLCNYNQNSEPIQGHGQEFRNIFKLLVEESIKTGLYRYDDYRLKPKEYCGIMINSTILPGH
jgi:predicted metal-dependent hydrolase